MAGGEPGAVGANYWMKKTTEGKWTTISLGASNQTSMRAGDRIVVRECIYQSSVRQPPSRVFLSRPSTNVVNISFGCLVV